MTGQGRAAPWCPPGGGFHPCQVPRIVKAMAREAGLARAVVVGPSGHGTGVAAAATDTAGSVCGPGTVRASPPVNFRSSASHTACCAAQSVVARAATGTRVGAAQDMVAEGIGMPAILHAGRWRTTAMVNRYGEQLLARRSGAAQLARLQGRQ